MATLTFSGLTLVELAKRHDPDGNTAVIAEVLNETNEILTDAVWTEANDVFSHKYTRRLALPSGTHRKLNEGISRESSRTVEARDVIAFLESTAVADIDLVNAAADPAEFRMNEAQAFIEGMGQTMAGKIIYGNATTTPEEPTGWTPRLNSLDADGNCIGASGTGSDTMSVWVVMWGLTKAFMIYPRNSKTAGIEHEDMGIDVVTDSSSNEYRAYRDWFKVNYGFCLKDDRALGRIANIEYTGGSNEFDEDDLITLIYAMPAGEKVIYGNRWFLSQAHILLKDKTNVNFTAQQGEGLAGEPVVRFLGHPIRRLDQLLITETAIS